MRENLDQKIAQFFPSKKVRERFVKFEKEFPGLIKLAISIKTLPATKREHYRFKHTLVEEIRQITNQYENGAIKAVRVRSFISKTNGRIVEFLGKEDFRKEIEKMVEHCIFIKEENKLTIKQLLWV